MKYKMTDEHTKMIDKGLCPFCGFDFKELQGKTTPDNPWRDCPKCGKVSADIQNDYISQFRFNVEIEYPDSHRDHKILF